MKISLPLLVGAYLLCWIPYIALTRATATIAQAGFGRPLAGTEILPVSLIVVCILMYAFFWLSGWQRFAHRKLILGTSFPVPTRLTALAGAGAMLLLVTVPLSFTFAGVSIPFVQLLMRGDVLLIAPLVDVFSGRRVRWYSWVALVMVAVALSLTIQQRGGLLLPPLCILIIVVYTIGYFIRLAIMTRVSKTSDDAARKRYFVEEQMVAYPLTIAVLGILALIGHNHVLLQIRSGFINLWSQSVVWVLIPIGIITAVLGIFAALILLDKRENTFCVPLERSASVLGGIAAAYVLAWHNGLPKPTNSELIGVALLVGAITVLSLGAKWSRPAPAVVNANAVDSLRARS